MAVIRSNAIGKARKSVGGITYRLRKGRTLAARKRGPSAASKAMVREQDGFLIYPATAFYFCQYWCRRWHNSIKKSFDKSRKGSEFNNFARLNMKVFQRIVEDMNMRGAETIPLVMYGLINEWCELHPNQMVRIKKKGMPTVYNNGSWWEVNDPDGSKPTD